MLGHGIDGEVWSRRRAAVDPGSVSRPGSAASCTWNRSCRGHIVNETGVQQPESAIRIQSIPCDSDGLIRCSLI
jgi:hypothetical protein